ncbi:uncharacterized protein LOC133193341 [Saccostrea echinata]|uniref:uncharacterized protein LOC133193341 n=1 Tax=Saccostrea echinata TaxID=191078 RepID=UPI002A8381D2|nr:uncharacterized protein LOC133193341 [Saccostrea echinata]
MRGKLRKVAATGLSIITAADMKDAIDKDGGILGCQAAHVELSSQLGLSIPKNPIKGVSKISNITFGHDNELKTWRAYNIGEGKELVTEVENTPLLKLDVKTAFKLPWSGVEGSIKEPHQDSHSGDDQLISCPETGCTSSFNSYSDMQNHCLLGSHQLHLQRSSTYDMIKIRWKDACVNLTENFLKDREEADCRHGESKSNMGWALKKDKKTVRFSEEVKHYLQDIFDQGERSGNKVHPSVVAQNMRVAVKEDGSKRFKPHQYPALGQISSYFSRLAVIRKSLVNSTEFNDEDLESVLLEIRKAEASAKLLD